MGDVNWYAAGPALVIFLGTVVLWLYCETTKPPTDPGTF